VSSARRAAKLALRAGDVSLAVELYAVAQAIELDELRRAESLELRQLLQPEQFSDCSFDGRI